MVWGMGWKGMVVDGLRGEGEGRWERDQGLWRQGKRMRSSLRRT
jgi:hypothetical protein